MGYLCRRSVASQRDQLVEESSPISSDYGSQSLFNRKLKAVFNRAWMDGVDPYPARPGLLGQTPHQANLGMLGCDIGVDSGVAPNTGNA